MSPLTFFGQFGLQLALTVGVILLTGLVIAGAKRIFLRCCGSGAYYVELTTGLVGTPIHELSHAVFCILFGHRITRICLWTPKPENGSIGYVMHTYKKRNLWHQIGNFFIGVAPIVGGSAVLLLLLRLLLPETAASVGAYSDVETIGEIPALLLDEALVILRSLFTGANLLRFHFYLYLLLAVLILLHMEISRSDLKAGLWGFLFLTLAWLLVDGLLAFLYPIGLTAVTAACVRIGAFLATFLSLSVLLSLLLLLVSFVVLPFRRRG